MELPEFVDHKRAAPRFHCGWESCTKAFTRKSDLVRHCRIHLNDRRFVCHVLGCGKRFIQRSALTVHIRTHTGEKPYHCQNCGMQFSDSSARARHRRIHTGERSYTCTYEGCRKSFCRRSTLVNHLRRSHQAKLCSGESSSDSTFQGTTGCAYPTSAQGGDEEIFSSHALVLDKQHVFHHATSAATRYEQIVHGGISPPANDQSSAQALSYMQTLASPNAITHRSSPYVIPGGPAVGTAAINYNTGTLPLYSLISSAGTGTFPNTPIHGVPSTNATTLAQNRKVLSRDPGRVDISAMQPTTYLPSNLSVFHENQGAQRSEEIPSCIAAQNVDEHSVLNRTPSCSHHRIQFNTADYTSSLLPDGSAYCGNSSAYTNISLGEATEKIFMDSYTPYYSETQMVNLENLERQQTAQVNGNT